MFYSNTRMDLATIKSQVRYYNTIQLLILLQNTVCYALGDERLNWISARDIGECGAIALIEGEKHYGKDYNLTGPDSLTGDETAKIIGNAVCY